MTDVNRAPVLAPPPGARLWTRGRDFADFAEGEVLHHHWGRTVTEADAVLFATATLAHNPLYWDRTAAAAAGHADLVASPYLVLCIVIGLSVEDLSERSEAFLGLARVAFVCPVHVGDTLTARSTVVERRRSRTNPGRGIVTWDTEGHNQDGRLVVTLRRTNLFAAGVEGGGG